MALDIALQTPDSDRFQLRWSRKLSLTSRILAVNLFALALMASGLFFLDSYRTRLVAERQEAAETQVVLLASAIARMSPADAQATLSAFAKSGKSRVRLYDQSGDKTYDSAAAVGVTFQLADPSKEPWRKTAARWMDMGFDFLVQAPDLGQLPGTVKGQRCGLARIASIESRPRQFIGPFCTRLDPCRLGSDNHARRNQIADDR